ncbi:cleavage and polyadenylation specificity factor subunit 2-like protein [Leptotrombidium deliense]|uniref:Cleavage and polyadenylation specificity factor subunit 2 n=1 Tax=Leptotrombidium deliense TaxID=299467 RepID=A0A443SC90_9ACAR|nr:cleavage and polyadenylation specificity factor subunit 2-like protein [Leptotrombidium deliense]
MTSIIKFKALSGAMEESPPSYILLIDEFTFLLDCGWNENFSQTYIRELNKHIKQIDAVLLSHPDSLHLGALPYLVGKMGLNCPIYATIPVYKMGQMFMYDLHQSRHNYEDFTLFSLDDVDAAFERIIQLKYNQSVALKGKGQGLSITPLPAGHMIGGTIWRIVKDGEEDIVYAVDFNHKRERHLNGCVLEHITRPSLLITDAYNALYTQARRKQRDEQLMTNILSTLRNSGNVLIAVDTAGRLLELAHMLDQLWRTPDSGLMAYSLALLNTVSYNVIEFAKSQVEWMSDKIMRSFEGQRNNPFQFKHLQLCHVYNDILRVREPRVVLASQPDLECGFARELFIEWAKNPKNSVILTQRCSPDTLANKLMQMNNNSMRLITLEIKERLPLQGLELEEYRRQQKLKTSTKPNQKATDSDSDSDENVESDDETMQTNGSTSNVKNSAANVAGSGQVKHDLMMPKSEGKVKGGSFFKQAKKSYPMFPAPEQKMKWDDYGEIINPEDFMIFDHSMIAGNHCGDAEENKENKKEAEEALMMPEANEIPTKCVVNVQTFNVNAKIQYIDFEGRSDGESLKKIISMIKPRRLILVRGSSDSIKGLADYCKSAGSVSNKLFTPSMYEIVDATTESHIYQVKLKDSLVSSLSFSQAKDGAELAWVEAEIEMPEEESLLPQKETAENKTDVEMKDNDDSSGGRDLLPTLRPLPATQLPSHYTIFINELKLSDFKQVLMKSGVQAEFSGGVLYCNNQVAVRRNETGRIHLEGTLCDDYFKVRDLLYQQYAIV